MSELANINHDIHSILEKALDVYRGYYDVNHIDPIEPFHAEAIFRLHNEQYFLVKKARIAEADSYEYAFFYKTDYLTPELIEQLDKAAWDEGMRRARPQENHKNTDVTLFIVAKEIPENCKAAIKKAKHYQSYKFGFHGFSAFRLVVYDVSEGKALYNRRGSDLKRFVSGIEILKEKEKNA